MVHTNCLRVINLKNSYRETCCVEVRESKICFNCLSAFHSAEKCRSKYVCFKYKKKHNTLLHYDNQQKSTEENQEDQNNHNTTPESTADSSNVSLLIHQNHGHVFLATAMN